MGLLCACEIDWAATGAMIGGIATGVYALFTLFLWLTAKKDLRQTQKLHQDNINLTKQLHETDSRPWIEVRSIRPGFGSHLLPGVSIVRPVLDERPSSLIVELYNHGKSPGRITTYHIGWTSNTDPETFSGENRQTLIMPATAKIDKFHIEAPNVRTRYTVTVLYNAGGGENYSSIACYVCDPTKEYSMESDAINYK